MVKISVIIPAYNAGAYIIDCLDSIVEQHFDHVEIIVVNDGSKDNTAQLCEQYIAEHKQSRIKLIHQVNSGVSVARNRGIAAAVGEWILFLDADDCLISDTLHLWQSIQTSDADVVLCEFSENLTATNAQDLKVTELDALLMAKCCLRYAKYHKTVRKQYQVDPYTNWSACAKFYRLKWIQQHSILFPEGVFTSEDFLFILNVFLNQPRVLGTNIHMYYYRANEQSVTHTFNPRIFENYITVFSQVYNDADSKLHPGDIDAYISERIVDCVRRYLAYHSVPFDAFLKQQLRMFYEKGYYISILNCPLHHIFVGKKNRIYGTYWLLKIKKMYWKLKYTK